MTVLVVILASLLAVTALALAVCVRVFISAPGTRALTTVSYGRATETWVWRPWRGWRCAYRVTFDAGTIDYTAHTTLTGIVP